ncbi:unnamed protein product [Effrenium voratum]|uniref:EF-hand domain-containing protein n=1 Tax=Effrenium voratum TaxID=2562239 RepID=A0AA36IG02_9DINO|nr:unnamed protein product [Effrenium voratum]
MCTSEALRTGISSWRTVSCPGGWRTRTSSWPTLAWRTTAVSCIRLWAPSPTRRPRHGGFSAQSLYILLSGRQPFYGKNNKEIMKQAKSGRFSMEAAQWQEISPDAQDLIRHLLVLDPSQRLTAAQALEHEWIAKGAPQASWSLFGLDGLNIMENLRRFSAHSRLKRSALQVIATQMTDEKIQDLQKAFEAIDKNDDGKVTVEELCDALQRRGAELPKDARETLSKMDIMEKGHISYPEFLASALDARDCLCEEACWTAFKAFDENDDGHISASELLTILEHQALQELPQSPSPKKMISEVDVNGTGQIEFDEFMRMIISERENPSRVETD